MQHATVQTKTRVRKQRRQIWRQQYLLPAAPTGFPFPLASFCLSDTRAREKMLTRRLQMLPLPSPELIVRISWQWDATEHGETWTPIHAPLNHEATPFARDPCQCWTWRRDLVVPRLALPPHSQLSGDTGTCGDMGTQSQADPGAILSPRYAQKVAQLSLDVKPPQFCSGFLSSPPLFKKAP